MAEPKGTKIAEAILDDWYPESGWVRTRDQKEAGHEDNKGYSTNFYLVHEVHGAFDAGENDMDNASLLVFRVEPTLVDRSQSFLRFKVTLRCSKARPDDQAPFFAAADPALGRERVLDEFVINRTKTATRGGSLNIQAAGAPVTGGATASWTTQDGYTLRERHTICCRIDRSTSRADKDTAWWELRAAPTAGQGVGDSLTVAVVVCRGKGQQFTIVADTEADMGTFRERVRKINPFHKKKDGTLLGTYGPVPAQKQEIPDNVDPNNLKASTDVPEVVRNNLNVGVHVPEKEDPLTTPAAPSPIPAAPQHAEQFSEAKATVRPTPPATTAVKTTAAEEKVAPPPATTPQADGPSRDPPKAAMSAVESKPVAENLGFQRPPRRVATANNSGPVRIPPTYAGSGPTMGPGRLPPLHSRADRHLKMAALYRRLAELHAEEAMEALGQEAEAFLEETESRRWDI